MLNPIDAAIEDIQPLSNSILKILLKPKTYISYEAGQYLELLLDEERFCYSIANAPLGASHYELHLRHSPDNVRLKKLLEHIKTHRELQIILPYGQCHLKQLNPQKDILFIAGGTGFAPIKAMIEQLLANSDKRLFELYWGAHSQGDLYMDSMVKEWRSHVENFGYTSLLSGSSKETLASIVIDKHRTDLSKWQVVIGGPFEMAYSIRNLLAAEGVLKEAIFSDAFSFENE